MCVVSSETPVARDELVERLALRGGSGHGRPCGTAPLRRRPRRARLPRPRRAAARARRPRRGTSGGTCRIRGQLGMEAEADDPALTHADRLAGGIGIRTARVRDSPRDDLDARADAADPRRADEHAVERRVEHRGDDLGAEGVDLPAVRVALDRDVDHAERRTRQRARSHAEQDQPAQVPSAGALAHERLERRAQPGEVEQPDHRGRLAARQHDGVEVVEVGRHRHPHRLHPGPRAWPDGARSRPAGSARRRALAGGPARAWLPESRRHQPRLASSCSSGSDWTSIPFIGTPRPVLT